MSKDTELTTQLRVGVVGGGQLARMMAESARNLPFTLCVMGSDPGDSAAALADEFSLGSPHSAHDLALFASEVDCLTFDHELVNLEAVHALTHDGHHVYPTADSLRFAVHKAYQRTTLAALGILGPAFAVLEEFDVDEFDIFAAVTKRVPVVKADHGGYDGRGVLVSDSLDEARIFAQRVGTSSQILLEEPVDIVAEVAVIVVTSRNGERVAYPPVLTRQVDGMCVEVSYPAGLDPAILNECALIADRVADLTGTVGVLAVELFVTSTDVVLNEVATRPHNSGHWTIEGAATSQFENHLRAVAGWPLGDTTPTSAFVTMVNVVGSERPGDPHAALAIPGAHIHDYGKTWRPGRKLGHVTVCGDDDSVVSRAWMAAEALGTSARRKP